MFVRYWWYPSQGDTWCGYQVTPCCDAITLACKPWWHHSMLLFPVMDVGGERRECLHSRIRYAAGPLLSRATVGLLVNIWAPNCFEEGDTKITFSPFGVTSPIVQSPRDSLHSLLDRVPLLGGAVVTTVAAVYQRIPRVVTSTSKRPLCQYKTLSNQDDSMTSQKSVVSGQAVLKCCVFCEVILWTWSLKIIYWHEGLFGVHVTTPGTHLSNSVTQVRATPPAVPPARATPGAGNGCHLLWCHHVCAWSHHTHAHDNFTRGSYLLVAISVREEKKGGDFHWRDKVCLYKAQVLHVTFDLWEINIYVPININF